MTVNAPSSVTATVNVTPAVAMMTTWTKVGTAGTVGITQSLQVTVARTDGTALDCDAIQGRSTGSYGKVQFLDGTTVVSESAVSSSGSAAGLLVGARKKLAKNRSRAAEPGSSS